MRVLWGAVLAFAIASGSAVAQTFPSRPVTMVVPYAAGGTTDVLARIIGKSLTTQLGQPIIIENVTGAGGTAGTQRVLRSDPDGYTLSFGNAGSMAANASLYPHIGFDPRRDFAPVGVVAVVPVVLGVSKKSGIKDMAAFLDRLKREGERVNYGTAGVGSTTHLNAAAFRYFTGTRGTLVNYRGSGPALNDLIGGTMDALIEQTVIMMPSHLGGSITAIAVSGPSRMTQMPDVPTFAEAGVPAFNLSVWNAIAAPKGTPPEVVARLEAALNAALDDPEVKTRFTDLASAAPPPSERGSAAFRRLIATDVDRLGEIIRAAGIKPE